MPIYYDCQRCTACCRWPGQVRVSGSEIGAIAEFLGLTENDFIQQHTTVRADRQGLAFTNKQNHECTFLDGNDCSIQPVKPQQCRDFPNRWNFPGFDLVCHAIPREVSKSEYEALTKPKASR